MYRALLDTAHLGNTEINAVGLSSAIEHLKLKAEDGREKCKLEAEFEVSSDLKLSPIIMLKFVYTLCYCYVIQIQFVVNFGY